MLAAWFLLNLLQAIFTELFHDEAYYWMFSQNLAWGYAEHAPLIAVLVRLTSWIPGEIGVRLFPVLLSTGTLYLMTQIAQPKNLALWFLLILSVVGLHIGAFFTAPDAPLVFFTALFFFFYQKFLEKESWLHTLYLALAVIGMLYSKYHGIMILGCTLLSNISLLKNKKFWTIVIVAGLAWSPVLLWLIEQRFSTFTFHLFNRVRKPYDISFSLNYILSQFLILGPLVGVMILPAAFLTKVPNKFERAMKFCVIGVLSFLLLVSFKTWVEANWSASAMIPAILLAYPFILQRPKWKQWLIRLGPVSIGIFLLLRLNLMVNLLGSVSNIRNEVHNWPEWAEEIKTLADGRPVVFYNTYQQPAKYSFYAGVPSHSVNNYLYHKTQYDNWDFAEQFQGQDVLFCSRYPLPGMDTISTIVGIDHYYREIPRFQSYGKIKIDVLNDQRSFQTGETTMIPIRIINPYPASLRKVENPNMLPRITCNVFEKGRLKKHYYPLPAFEEGLPKDTLELSFPFSPTLPPGEYEMIFAIRVGWLDGSINGEFEKILIQ